MPKYYEAEALIEFVKQYSPRINGATTLECVERAIRNAPTSDVVPRRGTTYMIKADGSLEMIPTVESVIAEFKGLVLDYIRDKDLLLVVFKNALEYAETELKKKHIGEKK